MKKLAVIYAVMLALTILVPAAVCFISKSQESESVVSIFHSAITVIDAFTLLK